MLLATLILLAVWQLIAVVAGGITLIDVAVAFRRLVFEGDAEGHTLVQHAGVSLGRVILGFSAAVVTAVPLGIATGRYKFISSIFGPVIEAMRPIPPIAWIPVSILMFRPSISIAQVFIIWIGAFFPLWLNTVAGVKRTNPVHLDVARTFGARESQVLSKIVLPSAAPEILAGFRIGFGIGWMCLVAAEMVGGGLGLGYLVIVSEQLGRTAETISAMIVIGLFGFLITYLFLYVERHMLRWRRDVAV
jgi:NitT/TauT family transport system permease protein